MFERYNVTYTDSYNSIPVTKVMLEFEINLKIVNDTNFKIIRKELII